jgi:hypothetical protein
MVHSCHKESMRAWFRKIQADPELREKRKEATRESVARWRARHRGEYNERMRIHRLLNKQKIACQEKMRRPHKLARLKADPIRLENRRRLQREFRTANVNARIRLNLQRRILSVLRGYSKSASTTALLGCSIEEFKLHLESQFRPGMSWDNYGRGPDKWNIDHKIPCAMFDLESPVHQKRCFHFSNLQPLWAVENSSKRHRLDYRIPLQSTN